jgi:hypothetical protein
MLFQESWGAVHVSGGRLRRATCCRTQCEAWGARHQPPGHIPRVQSVLSPGRPAIAITYAPADEYLETIRRLDAPSLIAVVSVSSYFLEMAGRLLAPALGRRHSMRGYLMAGGRRAGPRGADFVLCDCVTYPLMRPRYKSGRVFMYGLISTVCLEKISSVMGTYAISSIGLGVRVNAGGLPFEIAAIRAVDGLARRWSVDFGFRTGF